jgi:hypothetical protein
VISRNTQGVKLIEMEEEETLVGAATLAEDDSNGNGEEEGSEPGPESEAADEGSES